jgi:hypothetical protein
VVLVVDFDGDGDMAARTSTLRFRTSWQARGISGCLAMVALQSSTLAGHVAVAVKGHVHDDEHD